MKSFIKNLVLLATSLILSHYLGTYFGFWYTDIFPDSLNGLWIGAKGSWEYIIGFPFAYIFFVTLLFQIFGGSSKNKWNIWLLIPALLFFGSGDLSHIYLPILLGLIAFGLAKIVNKIIPKSKS